MFAILSDFSITTKPGFFGFFKVKVVATILYHCSISVIKEYNKYPILPWSVPKRNREYKLELTLSHVWYAKLLTTAGAVVQLDLQNTLSIKAVLSLGPAAW